MVNLAVPIDHENNEALTLLKGSRVYRICANIIFPFVKVEAYFKTSLSATLKSVFCVVLSVLLVNNIILNKLKY